MNTKALLRVLGFALMGVSLLLLWPSADAVHANPSIDAAAGRKAWEAKLCKNCHGADAEGKYARPLAGYNKTAQDVINQVRQPFRNMPTFNDKQVSDQELRDIFDYFQTLSAPANFTAVTYQPQPGDEPGKVLFNQKRCVACHGDFSPVAGAIVRSGRKTLTTEEVIKQLRAPRQNMGRFTEAQVSDAEAAQIAAYLKPIVEKAAGVSPSTLPKSGADQTDASLALGLGLSGIALIALSFVLRRRQSF